MRPLRLAVLASVVLVSGAAGAEVPSRAEELWERGAADWRAGKLDTGCPAIEESYQLDPRPGALFGSAECHAQLGKLLAAVQRYEAYLALAPQLSALEFGRRSKRARDRVQELKPLIPRLELALSAPATAGVTVTLDGSVLPAEQLGSALPVEVGPHLIETRTGGGSPWRVEVTLDRGETRRVLLDVPAPASVVTGAISPGAGLPGSGTHGSATVSPVAAPADVASVTADAGSGRLMSTLGWVANGIGAAGIVMGSVAGLSVLHQKSIVDDECNLPLDGSGKKGCTDRGWKAVERGESRATIATVGFGVGVAALVTGTLLLLQGWSTPSTERSASWKPQLRAGADGAWLGVSQAW